MAEEPNSSGGYGKRPLWQWVVIYIVIAGIVYGLIYYFVSSKYGGYNSTSETYTATSSSSHSSYPTQSATSGQNVVTYTNAGFSPSTLAINKGDTVTFKNAASAAIQVASNPHPIHNGYPTIGGCVSSTFDSCTNIAPGQTWSFKFDIVGRWGYHNHLNPSYGGTIVVQ